jgi:hypothetical protein
MTGSERFPIKLFLFSTLLLHLFSYSDIFLSSIQDIRVFLFYRKNITVSFLENKKADRIPAPVYYAGCHMQEQHCAEHSLLRPGPFASLYLPMVYKPVQNCLDFFKIGRNWFFGLLKIV